MYSLSTLDLIFARIERQFGCVKWDNVGLGGPLESVSAPYCATGQGTDISSALSDFAWRNDCQWILDVESD
jgi:hypothetical protein